MTPMQIWSAVLGAVLLVPALLALAAPAKAAAAAVAFPRAKTAGWILSAVAWAGAARETARMNIDVFDMFLNRFPAEPWILGFVLCVLCILFMPDLLPVRALSGIMMLFPTPLFQVTRLEASDWRLAVVSFAYVCLTAGMFFMFYPWHARRLIAWLAAKNRRIAAAAGAAAALGALFVALAFTAFAH